MGWRVVYELLGGEFSNLFNVDLLVFSFLFLYFVLTSDYMFITL